MVNLFLLSSACPGDLGLHHVLAPVLQEAAQRIGIDGVHFGTIMVVNLRSA